MTTDQIEWTRDQNRREYLFRRRVSFAGRSLYHYKASRDHDWKTKADFAHFRLTKLGVMFREVFGTAPYNDPQMRLQLNKWELNTNDR